MIRKSVVAAGVLASAVVLTGCSGGSSGTSSKAPKVAASHAKPPKAPTPVLVVGQPVAVRLVGDGAMTKGTSTYRVTLVGVKTAVKVTDPSDGYTAHADKGDVIACAELKVQSVAGKADTYPFVNPSFEGADGRAADAELATGVNCKAMGLAYDDLSGEPEPKPGQFIDGSQAVEVPAGGGDLLFTDRSGADLFKVALSQG